MSADAGGPPAALEGVTLAIDASTYAGTVAVLRDGVVCAAREAAMRGEREERLMPAVAAALAEAGVGPAGVARVVCGAGPGSFTSLRIAGAIAKGLAVAANVPLYAVPSLALAAAAVRPVLAPGRWLVTLDALRGERYAALVTVARVGTDKDAGGAATVTAYESLGVVTPEQAEAIARERGAWPTDAGAHPPHARGVAGLGPLLAAIGAVDLDAWEPDYGRKAEAQVKWEAQHGRALPATVEQGA